MLLLHFWHWRANKLSSITNCSKLQRYLAKLCSYQKPFHLLMHDGCSLFMSLTNEWPCQHLIFVHNQSTLLSVLQWLVSYGLQIFVLHFKNKFHNPQGWDPTAGVGPNKTGVATHFISNVLRNRAKQSKNFYYGKMHWNFLAVTAWTNY